MFAPPCGDLSWVRQRPRALGAGRDGLATDWYKRDIVNSISTFLMFSGEQHGKAEEAMKLYTSVFANSAILSVERWGPGEPGTPGFVKVARFSINGVGFMASDSAYPHAFNFTPSISMFVDCESSAELQSAFDALSAGGMELMPLDDYGFSTRFGWVQDRYGVSWQINLA